jgi:hypothetical protein
VDVCIWLDPLPIEASQASQASRRVHKESTGNRGAECLGAVIPCQNVLENVWKIQLAQFVSVVSCKILSGSVLISGKGSIYLSRVSQLSGPHPTVAVLVTVPSEDPIISP